MKTKLELDTFFEKIDKFQTEITALRSVILETELTEELKWGVPCYTYKGKNIVLINAFKEYYFISFVKGVLLKDPHHILVKQTENSNGVRLVKFTNLDDLIATKTYLQAYINEAIENEKKGLKVSSTPIQELNFDQELTDILEKDEEYKNAFETLTAGKQRGYHIYFSSAKQSQTKIDRILKVRKRILNGKGINDCTCGFSKKMPSCDGSHKHLMEGK